jgi:hypothetical protein
VWPDGHPHRFLHPHHLHGHGHAFLSLGYSSFYAPSYYRYRDYCDPYSFYYDPRYCYRYDSFYGPSAYGYYGQSAYGAAPPLTGVPTASTEDTARREWSDEDVRSERIPDGGLRVPLISSPDPPDAVF